MSWYVRVSNSGQPAQDQTHKRPHKRPRYEDLFSSFSDNKRRKLDGSSVLFFLDSFRRLSYQEGPPYKPIDPAASCSEFLNRDTGTATPTLQTDLLTEHQDSSDESIDQSRLLLSPDSDDDTDAQAAPPEENDLSWLDSPSPCPSATFLRN